MGDASRGTEAFWIVLALLEKLGEKKQNLGSVRLLEPFLTEQDVEAIMERAPQIMAETQKREATTLLLPPGARGGSV